jgi:hypothetical protein
MPLTSPNLDDRDFKQLMSEATEVIKKLSPQWTDLSPGDPGIVLLEAFAFLTDVMIYRLNRLPDKAYIEFLRLLGVELDPPSAARVQLRFTLSRAQNRTVEIPRHTRVTLSRSGGGAEAPVFVTARIARIEPGQQDAVVLAHHCEPVEGELLGIGTGGPAQTFASQATADSCSNGRAGPYGWCGSYTAGDRGARPCIEVWRQDLSHMD